MKRHRHAVRRPAPSYFVDRTSRQDKGSAGIRTILEDPATGRYLVFDRPAEYYVEEVLDVRMSCNDAGRNGVVFEHQPRPAYSSTRQRRASVEELLGPPFPYHLNPGKSGRDARRLMWGRYVRWSSKMRNRHPSSQGLRTANDARAVL